MNPEQRLLDNKVLDEELHISFLVGFSLDPIAEYIGALAHAEICCEGESAWYKLINKVGKLGSDSRGFKIALQVTHRVYSCIINRSLLI